MPRNITVTFDDGTTHVYQNAPDDVTPDAVSARAQKEFGKSVISLDGGRGAAPQAKPSGGVKQALGNIAAGAVRGAGSIGATLLAPVDVASDLIAGRGLTLQSNRERRAAMDQALGLMGAETDSLGYKAGKIGGEVAGTLGAGGVVAQGLRAVAPGLAAGQRAANVIRAIETAGAQGGGILSRSAGGAVTGAVGAGLVNPEDVGAGALIGGAAPTILKVAGKAGQAVGQTIRGTAADPQRLAAARAAQAQGYVIPPSDIRQQGAITELMGGLSGKIKTAQEASARNQVVTNNLAKKALGVADDAPLTRETLMDIRKRAGDAYETVRGAGTVVADDAYTKAIDKIGQEMQGAARSFPGLKKNDVADLIETLKQPQFDSGDAIDAIRVLRDQADSLFMKGEKGAAKAYKGASQALEDALDRHLSKTATPDALQAFRQARQTIAKTYTVEKALNSQTGDVSAQVLAKDLAKGKPLSAELRTVAQTAEAFPKATQALKESPKAVSPLDWAVGAMGGTATGNPLMLAGLAARPAVRAGLLSSPIQRMAARDVGPSSIAKLLENEATARLAYRSIPALAADR